MFDSPTTGVINLEWDDINQLISTTTFELNLETGERIYGMLAKTTGDGQLRVGRETGTMDLPTQTIVRLTPIESTLINRIEMRVDLGHSLAKANDLEQTSFGYHFRYRGEIRLINFDMDASTSSSESDPSSARVLTSFNYQRYLGELDWNPIGIGQLERNDELGIDQRLSFGGAMGRYLRDTNQSRITFAGGLVRSLEDDAGSSETTKDTEALLAMNLEWFQYDEPELDVSMRAHALPKAVGVQGAARQPRRELSLGDLQRSLLGLQRVLHVRRPIGERRGRRQPGLRRAGLLRRRDPAGRGHPAHRPVRPEGFQLLNFAPEAQCTPSRTALITAATPSAPETIRSRRRARSRGLVAWERTLGDLFSDAGYATMCMGKWHIGDREGRWPTDHGFDKWYGPRTPTTRRCGKQIPGMYPAAIRSPTCWKGERAKRSGKRSS